MSWLVIVRCVSNIPNETVSKQWSLEGSLNKAELERGGDGRCNQRSSPTELHARFSTFWDQPIWNYSTTSWVGLVGPSKTAAALSPCDTCSHVSWAPGPCFYWNALFFCEEKFTYNTKVAFIHSDEHTTRVHLQYKKNWGSKSKQ